MFQGNCQDDETFSDWDEMDDDNIPVKGLFDDTTFTDPLLFRQHHFDIYRLDINDLLLVTGDELETLIRLVNYIRRRVDMFQKSNTAISIDEVALIVEEIKSKSFIGDERNMIPVIPNDNLLVNVKRYFSLKSSTASNDGAFDDDNDSEHNHVVIETVEQQLSRYKQLVQVLTSGDENSTCPEDDSNTGYYGSYGRISIHETMLRDDVRTQAYCDAISSVELRNKTVLDVGCGTGILSLFAARSGARRVIGIDNSPIIDFFNKITAANNFQDIIVAVKGKIEDADLPLLDDEKVDLIVSEWMGYGLYFENMLSSVIAARDLYLSTDGIMMPSHAQLFIEAADSSCSSNQATSIQYHGRDYGDLSRVDRVEQWKNVYGFDMTDLCDLLTEEAQVQELDSKCAISDRCLAHELNMKSAADSDLDFIVSFRLNINNNAVIKVFVITFDVLFRGLREGSPPIVLSTSLQSKITHWQHLCLWLNQINRVDVSPGDVVSGTLSYRRRSSDVTSELRREYDILLEWKVLRCSDSREDKDRQTLHNDYQYHQKFKLT